MDTAGCSFYSIQEFGKVHKHMIRGHMHKGNITCVQHAELEMYCISYWSNQIFIMCLCLYASCTTGPAVMFIPHWFTQTFYMKMYG